MIGIITDSTCDIPDSLIEAYGIVVVPLSIIWGQEEFRDRIDIQPKEFYERLVKDPVYPKSSLPAMGEFLSAFDKVIAQGTEHIIVITISSAMSGTYNQARAAAEQISVPVTVIDAKGPSMALGWQVLEAVRAREEGADLDEILRRVEHARANMAQYVAMESIEYLHKGGRIGKAANWAGVMLKIRPLIHVNHDTGMVEPVSLSRTRNGLIKTLYKRFFAQFKGKRKLRVAVLHGGAYDEAKALAEQIQEEFSPLEVLINITGPVLGINTGPDALSLVGYSED